MGATKLNIKHISAINADDLAVLDFELCNELECKYILQRPLKKGEMVLIKASFKDACESEENIDENVLYRRRVVPLVTRVEISDSQEQNDRVMIRAKIENMTDDDRSYFYRKYFEGRSENMPLELDLEGKHIVFAGA